MPEWKEVTLEEAQALYRVCPECLRYRFKDWGDSPSSRLVDVSCPRTPQQFHDTYTDWEAGFPIFLVEVE